MDDARHVVITGGAGYIGSLLTGELLRSGWHVTVLDDLLFGGDSLVPYLPHPRFRFSKIDVGDRRAIKDSLKATAKKGKAWPNPEGLIHLAGIVGFPACQAVGRQVAWRYNVDATKRVFQQASELGVPRFLFSSSYSNYGLSADGAPVNETSALNPQSLYAETKIAAEEFLRQQGAGPCSPVVLRLATLYGISPRTRFDLIVNQFVLEAHTKRHLLIYQRGYSRSFVHVLDVVRAVMLVLDTPLRKIAGQIFNVGTEGGNYTKDEIVGLVLKRVPETVVEYKDLTFGGDMRDITVSFAKVRDVLGFETTLDVDDGIRDLLFALKSGLIRDPLDERYRNAQFIVQ
jgi:nucleoside-diphosphate-sugar epimerase